MLLKPRTACFTFLLGLLVAVAPISTDMFVPIMPEIASVFGTDVATATSSARSQAAAWSCAWASIE